MPPIERRDEGGKHGENQKGLVTFDRKIKKDPFYLYKAYWSKEPFVHLCGSRYVDRAEDVTEIKVYSNLPEVSLYKDGQLVETKQGDKVFTFQLPITGKHSIEARSGEHSSVILVNKVDAPNPDYAMDNRKNVTNWFDGELDELLVSQGQHGCRPHGRPESWSHPEADPGKRPLLPAGDVAAAVKDRSGSGGHDGACHAADDHSIHADAGGHFGRGRQAVEPGIAGHCQGVSFDETDLLQPP
ncbi:hypothetical protein ACKXF4_07020 [Faecalibacterium prausnitzii]|uniref:hypothetical protein n=1 Tax=Faecalibacterium prausnitzii TaxID=853 RepID=UPI003AB053FA